MTHILIKNATVLRCFPFEKCKCSPITTNASIYISNGRIERIASAPDLVTKNDLAEYKEIDAKGRLVMPGLVNAHTHLYSAFAKGIPAIAQSNDFEAILENLWWKLDNLLTPEACYYSALVSCIEAIKAGTTTLVDHHSAPRSLGMTELVKAIRETGMRAQCCFETTDRNGPHLAEMGLGANEQLLRSIAGSKDTKVQAMVGLHASFTLGNETLRKAVDLAEKYDVGCHIHLAEDPLDQDHCLNNFGCRVAERLDRFGVLNEKALVAHGVHLHEDELELLKERNCFLVHNPQSNMNNGVGVARIDRWKHHDLHIGLGTDAMTANMLEEVRTGIWLQKLRSGNPSCGFTWAPEALLKGNYKWIQSVWSDRFGCITPGAPADLIMLNYRPSTPLNQENWLGHLVFGASQVKVDSTIIDGEILMQDGQLTLLDESAVYEESRKHAQELWRLFQK